MNNEITAKRIKYALERKNMKAQELANMSGVNKASISQYVNGSHAPSNINAIKMSHVLGVDPMWLMGFDVQMFNEKTAAYNEVVKSVNAVDVLIEAFHRTGYYERDFTEKEIKTIMKYAKFLQSEEE